MFEPLRVRVNHRFGTTDDAFSLNIAAVIERWPAVLFGPSGAGKSSLLRILSGLDRADSSTITLGAQTLPPGRITTAVQYVAQRPALFPHLTVAQNVAFGIHQLSKVEQHSLVNETLTLLGAASLADRRPHRLSGGERQRVAIARALVTQPRLLLLDEAFAGLDNQSKQEIFVRLTALLQRRSISALYVTHEIADACALANEVVVLHGGRVVAQGPVERALKAERDRLLTILAATSDQPATSG